MQLSRLLFLVVIGFTYMSAQKPLVWAKGGNMRVAFVLLSEARLPKGEEVGRSFKSFAARGQDLQHVESKSGSKSESEILEFQIKPNGKVFVMLLPVAVPNGEADAAARYSLSSIGTDWKMPAHKAHLVVTCDSSGTAVESLSTFTSVLAAVADASPTVGIYWGDAGATHDPKFFLTTARDADVVPRMMLWTGVSLAREGDGRLSLLSLGMKQLNLPDLLLIAPKSAGNSALETFFDLLSYVASRGKALPEGDTVGRTPNEKLPVRYVPSPLDPKRKVWRVELK